MTPQQWTSETLASAARGVLAHRPHTHSAERQSWRLLDALASDDSVVLRFQLPDQDDIYVATVPVGDPLIDPCTGEVCESPAEWAENLLWLVMEETGTGAVRSWPADPATGARVGVW